MRPLSIPDDISESWLLELRTDAHKRIVIMTFWKRGRELRLRFDIVERLRLDDYFEQNIIDELVIYGAHSQADEVRNLLALLLFERETASEVTESAFREQLEACVADVLAERQLLLEIIPVVGARGLLLAGAAEWLEDRENTGESSEGP